MANNTLIGNLLSGGSAVNGSLTLSPTYDVSKGHVILDAGSDLILADSAASLSQVLSIYGAASFGSPTMFANTTFTAGYGAVGTNNSAGPMTFDFHVGARGNLGAPAFLHNNDVLHTEFFATYDGTHTNMFATTHIGAEFQLVADELHSTTASGTRFDFYTATKTTNTLAKRFTLDSLGQLILQSTSGANLLWNTDGAGDIGAPGVNRPNNIHAAGSIEAAVSINAGNSFGLFGSGGIGFYGTGFGDSTIFYGIPNGVAIYNPNGQTVQFNEHNMTFDGQGTYNLLWSTDGGGTIGDPTHRPNNIYAKTSIFIGNTSPIQIWQGATPDVDTTIVGASSGVSIVSGTNNSLFGSSAGNGLTTGSFNVYMGAHAGNAAAAASSNVAIGYFSGYTDNSGFNTFLGYAAGEFNTSTRSVLVGATAGQNVTSGSDNVYLGYAAGLNALTSSNNIAIGTSAGSAQNGGNNVFVGYTAGQAATGVQNVFVGFGSGLVSTGNNNILIGDETGPLLSTGNDNVYIGQASGFQVTSNSNNVAIGTQTGWANNGGNNVYIGQLAGKNATGMTSVFIGAFSGQNNTSDNSTGVGYQTLINATIGGPNSAFGYNALVATTTGLNNTAIGFQSGSASPAGSDNTYVGHISGGATTEGENVCIGSSAGSNDTNTSGFGRTVFIGKESGVNNSNYGNIGVGFLSAHDTSGNANLCLGYHSGYGLISGNANIFIGANAGNNVNLTGSGNVYIGLNSGPSSTSASGEFIVGADGNGINTYYIGQGYAAAVPATVLFSSSNGLGTDIAGSNFNFAGGKGTGTGAGGNIVFQVAPAGLTGSSLNGLQTALTINSSDASVTAQNYFSTVGTGSLAFPAFNINNNAGFYYSGGFFLHTQIQGVPLLQLAANGVLTFTSSNGNNHLEWDTDAGGNIGAPSGNRPFNIYARGAIEAFTQLKVNQQGTAANPELFFEANTVGFYSGSSSIHAAIAGVDSFFASDTTFTLNDTSLRWVNDGVGDIGASGAMRPANIYSTTSIHINGNDASACLEASSTTKGFLPPVMTTTQKNAIASPAEGLVVYDITLHKLSVFTGTVWETVTSL